MRGVEGRQPGAFDLWLKKIPMLGLDGRIDSFDPYSASIKRTGLGRFAHDGVVFASRQGARQAQH